MKYLSYLLFIALLSISCQSKESKDTKSETPEQAVEYVLFEVQIEGMTCTGCEETIEAGVQKVDGIGTIEANHVDGNAQIKFVKGLSDTSAVKKVIEAAGYKVTGFKDLSSTQVTE